MATDEGPLPVDEVSVKEVWRRLAGEQKAALIDVRTRAEWSFVGVPDLASLGKRTLFIEWQEYPSGAINPSFVSNVSAELAKLGADQSWDLYIICRSGARSLSAAKALVAAGYRRSHNATEGFEGPLDAARRRGQIAGWKYEDLPWSQG